MTRLQRLAVLALCILVAGGSLMSQYLPAAAPAKTSTAATRDPDVIMKDLTGIDDKLQEIMPSLASLSDPAFRNSDGQKALVMLKQMVTYWRELEAVVPEGDARDHVKMNRFRFMGLVSSFGDKETVASLEATAKGTGGDAVSAQSALALGRWLGASKDAAIQNKILDDIAVVAKANPTNDDVASTLGFMANVAGANDDVSKKAIEVIRANLKGEEITSLLAQLEAAQSQKDMVGKTLAFEGRTSTDGKFDTSQYKGKVVLVDFWATWCGPCIGELPNVKKAYADFHAKGLEIVGVSCDSGDAELNKFIKDNDMPWIQLRETSQSDEGSKWHPLAKKYGVDGIPTMFLIDRKGTLRYVDAREDLATKIKKLVDESDAAPATPAK